MARHFLVVMATGYFGCARIITPSRASTGVRPRKRRDIPFLRRLKSGDYEAFLSSHDDFFLFFMTGQMFVIFALK